MKKIILFIIAFMLIFQSVFADENKRDINKTVFYFPTGNYYYISDTDVDGFIDGNYSIEKAVTDDNELWKIFNSLFPQDSCYIRDCGINKKKLLFGAVLRYNYEKSAELNNEIEIAKTRYDNQSELNTDLNDIEQKVTILINNKNSYQESWYDVGHTNLGTQICNASIESGVIKYDFKKRLIGNNSKDIFVNKFYLLSLPLNIHTGFGSDMVRINKFSGKSSVFEINNINDIEEISDISLLEEVSVITVDNNSFSLNIDYLDIEDKLEEKLSKIYDTHNNQNLMVNRFRAILFNVDDDGNLSYISDIIPSYKNVSQLFTKSCNSIYKINNEESFHMELYNGGVNGIVANENNKLFVRKIDYIFDKLDRQYDFWDLDSTLNKKDYYLILAKLNKQIEKINISIDSKINYYNEQNFNYIVENKQKIENFFEKKMFINYLERKIDFRIEEGLIEYYQMD